MAGGSGKQWKTGTMTSDRQFGPESAAQRGHADFRQIAGDMSQYIVELRSQLFNISLVTIYIGARTRPCLSLWITIL